MLKYLKLRKKKKKIVYSLSKIYVLYLSAIPRVSLLKFYHVDFFSWEGTQGSVFFS